MDPFPPPPPPPWNPDDDFLLKNSVEGGASLESLAKGAVSFSRRYSILELREHWHSVLFDTDVSDKASAGMANLEVAKTNGNGIKEVASADDADRKRKIQSIRNHYYAVRKRLRAEVFLNSFDGDICDENNATRKEVGGSGVGNTNGSLNMDVNNNLVVDSVVNYGNHLGLVGAGAGSSHSMSEDPLWKTIEDVSAPNMSVHVSLENGGSESKEMFPHVSQDVLNLPNGDELMFVNIGDKDEITEEKQCDDNVDTILLCSPCNIQGNDMFGVGESLNLVAETKLAMASGSAELDVVANSEGSSHGDSGFVAACENEVQSAGEAAAQSSPPKPAKEFRICSLNTEDPNVPSPSNDIDDVNRSTVVPDSVAPKPISIVKEVGYPDSFISNHGRSEPDGSLKRKDIPSNSFAASQSVWPALVANIVSSKEIPVALPKAESPANNLLSAVSGQSNDVIVNINPSQSKFVHATMKHVSYEHPKQEVVIVLPSHVNVHSKEEEHKTLPALEAKSLCIDQERCDDDSDIDYNDNDDEEIPSFSDVEAMILEMDLDPSEQDANAHAEVMRYQDEETKRTIMRLEQCSQAIIERAIASRGAFAVLYGHTLKEYIDKPEVIIGRSASDIHVDIDLGREGKLVNKISRRQASIVMDTNGFFFIKNLGKNSIFLNGKETTTGQLRSLSSGSFIQIRDLSFIFDVNQKCVQRFLDDVNE